MSTKNPHLTISEKNRKNASECHYEGESSPNISFNLTQMLGYFLVDEAKIHQFSSRYYSIAEAGETTHFSQKNLGTEE